MNDYGNNRNFSHLDDAPRGRRTNHINPRPIGNTTVRALADAVSKISARLPTEGQNSEEVVDDKKVLDECAGLLLRIANKYTKTSVLAPVTIQLVIVDDTR